MPDGVPPRLVCPLCGHDDDVSSLPVGAEGEWAYTCAASSGHIEPYGWKHKLERHVDGREGITAELGLYDDLASCVKPGEAWVEHGVVEHRYRLLRPDVYLGELLPRYGHVAQGPKRYTVSALIAKALGQLSREGILAWQYARATGFWYYNGSISYWAVPPAPQLEYRLTWAEFAESEGLDPMVWSLAPPLGA